jgi:hypothetical protein
MWETQMLVAPTVPEVEFLHGLVTPGHVLAVIDGARERDECTLRSASALTQELDARLSVLCLWSLPAMWPWVALSGSGAAVQMLELHRRDLLSWLRGRLTAEGLDAVRILSSRLPDAPARVVGAELERCHYTCVIGSRRTLGRRASRRFRRGRPELTLVRL